MCVQLREREREVGKKREWNVVIRAATLSIDCWDICSIATAATGLRLS